MKKILLSTIVLVGSLLADDKMIIDFEKARLMQNPNITIKSVKIDTKKAMPLKGWDGYLVDVKANIGGKDINAKDVVFSDGKYIALDLIDSTTGDSLKKSVTPELTAKYYDTSKIIAGNPDAKDKIVIFSDPVCPFCKEYVPPVIKYVKEHSDKIALYYYHFPIEQLHPVAPILDKIMEVAKIKGVKDLELKMYETNWDKYFSIKETDEKKVLDAFNKVYGTNIKLSEIQNKSLDTEVQHDIQMGLDVLVEGTPTFFVNGVKDDDKNKYLTLGK